MRQHRDASFGFRFVAPLAFASTLNPINTSLISTAMVPVAHAFGARAADTAWLIGGLYLASAVAQPTMGKLADLLGPRRVLTVSLLLVAAAGLIGPLAPSLGVLIATRVLIGIGTSGAYPAAMRMFRDRGEQSGAPPPRTALGVLSLSSLTVAAIGPFLGGVLTSAFGWQAVFAVNLPLALAAMLMVLVWAPRDVPRSAPRGGGLDPVGLTLFAAFLWSAMLFLMRLSHPNGFLLALALVLGAALAVWSWRHPAPFLDLPMLVRNAPLTRTYLRFAAIMLVCYCVFYGFAQWLQGAGGYGPRAAGLMMVPLSVVATGASLVAARTESIRTPFVLACGASLAGSAALLMLGHGASPWLLAGAVALFGLPMGMASTATQAALYLQAPLDRIGSASGLQRTFGYFGSIASASLLATAFGKQPDDTGFHWLMGLLVGLSGVLLLAVIADRTLSPTPGRAGADSTPGAPSGIS